MRTQLLLIALLPAIARADALTDLRAALGQLGATTPVRGSLDVTTTSKNNEEERPDSGKVTVGFDVSDAGVRILYPKAALTQADQEARGEAIDPERASPTRSGFRHVRPLHVAELLDAAGALNVILESAQLLEVRPTNYRGKPSRVVVMKLTPKASKATTKHLKKLDGKLSVWIGDDGIPLGAERSMNLKASFLLMTLETDQKDNWTYTRSGDRLVVTRYDNTEKTDGLGQHESSQTTEVIRME